MRTIIFVVALLVFNVGGVIALFGAEGGVQWRMYHGYAMRTCSLELKDKTGALVDRYALLGYKRPDYAPKNVRRFQSARDLKALGDRLCKKTDDVRATLICGDEDAGWRLMSDPEKNLCAR